ncbi:potassium channel subfamily K member 16 [Neodiprion lecontei]|uniref:Potassium channel subfamily K member 16 n=1 Tax=Neodiprion lecontei TaxID=441921 RepID=A0A6J0CDC2_NEOLC|nr:potassium channel subfamily K member 16 [Neodiprion lecontei]XP_046415722.1 potassium channel subfamily K member 16 [Neodiprion fabricii]
MERQASRRWRGSYRRRRKKPWAERLADWTRNFIAFLFSNVGIVCLVVGYAVAGAAIFYYIEGEMCQKTLNVTRNEIADKLWNYTSRVNIFSEQQWKLQVDIMLKEYQKDVVKEAKNGYKVKSMEWTYAGAFLYSLTVITTIGYGNISPRTAWGKVATIIYAIAGMPLFLLYLSNIGDILARSFKWTYARCCLCRCRRKPRRFEPPPPRTNVAPAGRDQWQMVKIHGGELETSSIEQGSSGDDDEGDEESEGSYDPQNVTVPITLCLTIMAGYVCGGGMLFSMWEGWGFLESSYFCFISLSTIGFGDYVPSDEIYSSKGISEFSFLFCSLYLMLGMAMIAMCFNLMQEEVIAKWRTLIRTLRHIFRCDR